MRVRVVFRLNFYEKIPQIYEIARLIVLESLFFFKLLV